MPVLPDVLRSDLEVVFCGTAAGRKSAELGQYYAGPGNKFWEVLKDAGFVPVLLNPRQFKQVLDFRIGLTDLNKEQSGGDDELTSAGFDTFYLAEGYSEANSPPLAQLCLGLSLIMMCTASLGIPIFVITEVIPSASCFFWGTVRPSHISTITTGIITSLIYLCLVLLKLR